MSGVFRDEAERAAWVAELHAANATLASVAKRSEEKAHQLEADAVHSATGIFGGVPLPEEVRDAISVGRRAAGFVQYLPLDEKTMAVVAPIAEALELIARALGVK